MNAKKMAKAKAKAHYNPPEGIKESADVAKRDLKHKPPEVDNSAQEEAAEAVRLQKADLDEEENRRRKRLFSAAAGARAYRGAPMFRARPGNTTDTASASPAARVGAQRRMPNHKAAITER